MRENNRNINLSKGLKVLSPFNGISCGRVALERAGIEVERYVSYEIDDDANKVAKYNYPYDEYNGDVFEADGMQESFGIRQQGISEEIHSKAGCFGRGIL